MGQDITTQKQLDAFTNALTSAEQHNYQTRYTSTNQSEVDNQLKWINVEKFRSLLGLDDRYDMKNFSTDPQKQKYWDHAAERVAQRMQKNKRELGGVLLVLGICGIVGVIALLDYSIPHLGTDGLGHIAVPILLIILGGVLAVGVCAALVFGGKSLKQG